MRSVPMEAFPTGDELFWLFEAEPQIEEPDVGWAISTASFTASRGPWEVAVGIEPYIMYAVGRVGGHE